MEGHLDYGDLEEGKAGKGLLAGADPKKNAGQSYFEYTLFILCVFGKMTR